jgi:hypothetical protein
MIDTICKDLQNKDISQENLYNWISIIDSILRETLKNEDELLQNILIKIIFLIPWLGSDNHFKLSHLYEDLIMFLVSYKN